MLSQLVTEFVARAGSAGFKIRELLEALQQMSSEVEGKRR
jgi:GntR family transcriptional regulator